MLHIFIKEAGVREVKFQWNLILGLLFALIIAVFAVANVNSVKINYLFGYTEFPLILIIIGSALLGGLIVGMFGILRQYQLQRKIKKLEKEVEAASSPQAEAPPQEVVENNPIVEDKMKEVDGEGK